MIVLFAERRVKYRIEKWGLECEIHESTLPIGTTPMEIKHTPYH
jgi:hypothetical protein